MWASNFKTFAPRPRFKNETQKSRVSSKILKNLAHKKKQHIKNEINVKASERNL